MGGDRVIVSAGKLNGMGTVIAHAGELPGCGGIYVVLFDDPDSARIVYSVYPFDACVVLEGQMKKV